MTILTPDEARTRPCPIARIQGDVDAKGNVNPKCRADACMIWRWAPHAADDPRFVKAVRDEMARLGGGPGNHKKAVATVTADPEAHGVPTEPERGWCGLGGKP